MNHSSRISLGAFSSVSGYILSSCVATISNLFSLISNTIKALCGHHSAILLVAHIRDCSNEALTSPVSFHVAVFRIVMKPFASTPSRIVNAKRGKTCTGTTVDLVNS